MASNIVVVTDQSSRDDMAAVADRSEHKLAVVIDAKQQPIQVYSNNYLWTTLATTPETPLDSLLDNAAVLDYVNKGSPGLVVMAGNKLVGVLLANALIQYFDEDRRMVGETLVDDTLDGVVDVPLLILYCAECGARNEVRQYVEGKTMCVNNHLLIVHWG
jgi:hypothetical protein